MGGNVKLHRVPHGRTGVVMLVFEATATTAVRAGDFLSGPDLVEATCQYREVPLRKVGPGDWEGYDAETDTLYWSSDCTSAPYTRVACPVCRQGHPIFRRWIEVPPAWVFYVQCPQLGRLSERVSTRTLLEISPVKAVEQYVTERLESALATEYQARIQRQEPAEPVLPEKSVGYQMRRSVERVLPYVEWPQRAPARRTYTPGGRPESVSRVRPPKSGAFQP